MGDSADGNERLEEEAAAEIRASLERILASDVFRAAPQLSAFLSFIVERTVQGRRAELKGYTIAVEALGRPADFDPQSDPIVRVEAGRLRRTLTQYYAGEGRDDPVRIAIPVGAYVPAFELPGPAAEVALPKQPEAAPPEPASVSPETGRRWRLAALAVLACALLALLAWYLIPGLAERSAANDALAMPAPDLPTIAIVVPDMPEDPALAALVQRSAAVLVDVMARFDDLVTVKTPPIGTPLTEDIDYVLELSLMRSEGTVQGFVRLRTAKDGRIIWATSATHAPQDQQDDQDLTSRMSRIATRLVEPFGVIQAEGRQNSVSPAGSCIYEALDYQRIVTAERHKEAQDCLQRIIARDPGFYPARAHLAGLYLGDYVAGWTVLADPLLDKGLASALAAQRLAPSSGRAQQMVMEALFLRGAGADALSVGNDAMARNPYDPQIMANLGAVYVRLNRPREGLPLLERAITLCPGRPSWYDVYAYLAAYLGDAAPEAQMHFAVLAADTSPMALLVKALQAGRDGNIDARKEALRQLAMQIPLFGRDPKQFLARKGFTDVASGRILADLGVG